MRPPEPKRIEPQAQIALAACALVTGRASAPALDAKPRLALIRKHEPRHTTLLDHHLATMRRISAAPLITGNAVRLLVDGPASYEVTFDAIRAARDHVNIETYILEADEIGQQLAALLIEKQQQGVQVNLLYDAFGSFGTPTEYFDRLRASGINVCEFNPLLAGIGGSTSLNQRDHRKQIVIDGRIAVSGGINISSVYSSGSSVGSHEQPPSTTNGWRDTNVEIRGPAVAEFQKLFLASWEKQKGAPLAARNYFPPLQEQGGKILRVIGSSSDDEQSATYLALLSAIGEAMRSVDLTIAYFVPDEQMIEALTQAARRGVRVRLLLPGLSDSRIVLQAGRSYYLELLDAGVEIYELRGALLHAKTAVIDGVWSTVGSTNLDWRSLLHNDELNAIILGADFGSDMLALFEADLRGATPIERGRWRARGVVERLEQRMARLFRYWL